VHELARQRRLVAEGLCNSLASVAFGDMNGLAAMAENPEVNESGRRAAIAHAGIGQKVSRPEICNCRAPYRLLFDAVGVRKAGLATTQLFVWPAHSPVPAAV